MSQDNSRQTKTKKKTKLSVRGRISVYLDPATLKSHREKTLHFVGVGRLQDTEDVRDIEGQNRAMPTSKKTKPAVCHNCGRVWKKAGGNNGGMLKTCPECKIKRKIVSGIKVHIPV